MPELRYLKQASPNKQNLNSILNTLPYQTYPKPSRTNKQNKTHLNKSIPYLRYLKQSSPYKANLNSMLNTVPYQTYLKPSRTNKQNKTSNPPKNYTLTKICQTVMPQQAKPEIYTKHCT